MNRRWIMRLGMLLLTGAGLMACGGSDAERLVVTGSSTVAPLVNEIGRRYEREHPGVRVDVQTGGSTRGVNDARAGLAGIGMASRALRDDEADLVAYTIAWDGIAMLLHADNPLTELDADQVRAIFVGEIRNWQAVGGRDQRITVINKADGRSTLELFLAHFGLESREVRADLVIGDNEQGLRVLAGDPSAIAYLSIGTAETAFARGEPVRLLPLDGVAANTEVVRSGRFPLARPLNLITNGAPNGAVADFIAYAQSPAVADLVEALHFVPPDSDG